jgi:hypothetical protein
MKNEIPAAWGTAYDKFGDPNEALTASREGLVYLKAKIDEALEKGEAEIGDEAFFDFERIEIADIHPTRTLKSRPILDKIVVFLVLGFIVIVIALAICGGHAVYEQIAR